MVHSLLQIFNSIRKTDNRFFEVIKLVIKTLLKISFQTLYTHTLPFRVVQNYCYRLIDIKTKCYREIRFILVLIRTYKNETEYPLKIIINVIIL